MSARQQTLPLLCALALITFLPGCDDSSPPAKSVPSTVPVTATPASPFTAERERAAAMIDAAYLRDTITEISGDAYEGRGPGTPGDERARAWLVGELERLGLRPGAADRSWQQPFELVGILSEVPAKWSFRAANGELALEARAQYVAFSGVQREQSRIEDAELVFVGYGIQAPEYQWDDFKGADLRGKVLVMLNNDPDWDPALFQGKTRLYYGRYEYKYASAARQGALGAIIIHTTYSAAWPWSVLLSESEVLELPAGAEPRLEAQAWVTEEAARALVALGGQDLDALREASKTREFRPVPLGVTTSLVLSNTLRRTASANVLGLLPGSDPQLAAEAVVLTAHHDHLGIGEPDASGDAIYNGAYDNGAGIGSVLAIARALAALPVAPRRSVLVNFVGGEEQGLLGSRYYAANPTFAPGRIAANINYDGSNLWGRAEELAFVGKGKSSLDGIVEAVAARQGRVVVSDQFPDHGEFYRSDQFSFAQIGVPTLYIYRSANIRGHESGWGRAQYDDYVLHRYHQPSDEIDDSWNYEGMIEDAQIGFWTTCIVADQDEMPRWVPGDEFEAARQAALAELN